MRAKPLLLWSLLITLGALAGAAPALASPIYNNNGPVMSGPNSVYFIWYGNWGTNTNPNTATTLLPQFISNLGGSTYMNILSSYNQPSLYPDFSTQVNFGGSYFVNSNSGLYQGASLDGTPGSASAASITGIVNAVLTAGGFSGYNPATSVFDVLTATDTTVSGFQTTFCGWHYSTSFGQLTTGTQYGFIGDPTSAACEFQSVGPNNNAGADAMASVIAHEFFETVTDPTGMSWFDSISLTGGGNTGGYENGDMCNFNFGNNLTLNANGSYSNVTLNNTNYLLQQQWQNQGGGPNYSGGACVTSLAFATPTPEPPALSLLATGIAALGLIRRRRAPA